MCSKTKATEYLLELKEKWKILHQMPSVFAYTLNIQRCKFLSGPYKFYMEHNPGRAFLRRPPQTIPQLLYPFDEQKFNFKKIYPDELIMTIPYENADISMIINKSPLTEYHTLICPELAAGHAQCITPLALEFCVKFLHLLESKENAFRIGYNSPGALASVNHLHLQLLYIPIDLYIDNVKLQPLQLPYVFRLTDDMPTEAICFVFFSNDSEERINAKLKHLYEFIMWLCNENIPHNLFMTPYRVGALLGALKVFVYVREHYCFVKNVAEYNVGFCELSGYVTIGDENLYEIINEADVLYKIRYETGSIYTKVYEYFRR